MRGKLTGRREDCLSIRTKDFAAIEPFEKSTQSKVSGKTMGAAAAIPPGSERFLLVIGGSAPRLVAGMACQPPLRRSCDPFGIDTW